MEQHMQCRGSIQRCEERGQASREVLQRLGGSCLTQACLFWRPCRAVKACRRNQRGRRCVTAVRRVSSTALGGKGGRNPVRGGCRRRLSYMPTGRLSSSATGGSGGVTSHARATHQLVAARMFARNRPPAQANRRHEAPRRYASASCLPLHERVCA